MSVKAHQKLDGTWGPCKAVKRACPYGGDDVHREFSSIDEIEIENEKIIHKQEVDNHGILPSVSGLSDKEVSRNLAFIEVTRNAEERHEDFSHREFSNNDFERDPEELISEYFEARIRQHEVGGNHVDKKFNYSWENELDYDVENYGRSKDGGQTLYMNADSEDEYANDNDIAIEITDEFEEAKGRVDDHFAYAKTIDWSKHGLEQREGEIKALEQLLNDSGLYS